MTVSEIKRLAEVLEVYNPKVKDMTKKEISGYLDGKTLKSIADGKANPSRSNPLISPAYFSLNLSSVQLTASVKK